LTSLRVLGALAFSVVLVVAFLVVIPAGDLLHPPAKLFATPPNPLPYAASKCEKYGGSYAS
jgi:hypothetical protein